MTSSAIQGTYHVYDAIYFFFELYLEELGELVPHQDLTHRRMYLHGIPFLMVKFFYSKLNFLKKPFSFYNLTFPVSWSGVNLPSRIILKHLWAKYEL